MEKVLVTGGAGFIGSHVVDDLIKLGYDVTVLDDLSGGFIGNVNKKASFVQGSITDKTFVEQVFLDQKFKYVFHFAAYAAEGLSHFIRRFNYENNLIGSINLINESIKHDVECFVFTSSIAVYGKNQLPMMEETTPCPEDPYGTSKLAVEYDLKCAHEMFGLNYIIFRPHNVYGERQNLGDKYRNVIGIFMNSIMQNKPLLIFGDGEQTRAFTYVGDVAPIIANAPDIKEARNQIFNIGADTPYSVNYLAQKVIDAMGAEKIKENKINYPIIHHPPRNEVMHAYSAHEKVRNILGYKTRYSLEEGLKKMADWAKIVGIKKSTNFSNIEITKNLPPSWRT